MYMDASLDGPVKISDTMNSIFERWNGKSLLRPKVMHTLAISFPLSHYPSFSDSSEISIIDNSIRNCGCTAHHVDELNVLEFYGSDIGISLISIQDFVC